jgi:hypothetical protein
MIGRVSSTGAGLMLPMLRGVFPQCNKDLPSTPLLRGPPTIYLPMFRLFENCIYTLYFGNNPSLGLYLIDILSYAYWVQPFFFFLVDEM